MTKAEFQAYSALLYDWLLETYPDAGWLREDWLDHGFTHEYAGRFDRGLKVLTVHAWSWDGQFEPDQLRAAIAAAPPDSYIHLSDPTRPDHKGGA